MEFGKKLQSLRKSRGLTQEELAQSIYVSRTAVSKWESGRGYPSIDSIKDISFFFSITIDELLSSEKILSLAEKENKLNIQKICDLFFGIVDIFTVMLALLPLYPNTVNGYIYSVSLPYFTESSAFNICVYWTLFLLLTIIGILKCVLVKLNIQRVHRYITWCSLVLSASGVLFLILTRLVYATLILFALLLIKGFLFLRRPRA